MQSRPAGGHPGFPGHGNPFRIDADPVDEPFGRPAIANKEHMLLIIAVGPQERRKMRIDIRSASSRMILAAKNARIIFVEEIAQMAYEPSQAKKHERKEHKADDIGLADIGQFERRP